ncbi:hypothetical protein H8D85_02075 [bacterium]|nr:hypothetical protein [bacterium]
MNQVFKMATYNDIDSICREDVDAMLCALVRFGYNIHLTDDNDYIQFEIGNADIIMKEEE